MDTVLRQTALGRGGLLLAAEAAQLPLAQRRSLVLVQPGVLAAATTPLDAVAHLRAAELSAPSVVLAGRTAAWVHGLLAVCDEVDVAVPSHRQLVLLPPVRVRRLAPSLLRGARVVDGRCVVSAEAAVVQSAERAAREDLVELVECGVRLRVTTAERLRRTCRRGVAGSALLRSVLDEMSDGAVDLWPRRLRRALEQAGVQGLESEVPLRSSTGAVAHLDLLCRRARRAVEVDGWGTHGRRGAFTDDRRRDRWVLREHGISTTRVAVGELQADLAGVVADLLPLLQPPAVPAAVDL